MGKSSGLLCIFAILAVISSHEVSSSDMPVPAPAPAPMASCEDVIYNMMDCVTYISAGASSDRPTETCCSGVKSVLDFDGACICVAIKSSSRLGIQLNMTRVQQLPSLCKLKPYPLEKCGISGVSGPSPVEPPSPSPRSPIPAPPEPETPAPSTPKPKAPAPATAGGEAPAEAPKKSGCPSLASFSSATLFAIALAVCYSMLA